MERGLVYLEIGGARHPAIVVRLFQADQRALVLCGTGTRRTELVCIEVPERSVSARALGLTKTTFFYGNQLKSVRFDHLAPAPGKCPPGLFQQVRMLVEGALNTLSPSEPVKDLAVGAAP